MEKIGLRIGKNLAGKWKIVVKSQVMRWEKENSGKKSQVMRWKKENSGKKSQVMRWEKENSGKKSQAIRWKKPSDTVKKPIESLKSQLNR